MSAKFKKGQLVRHQYVGLMRVTKAPRRTPEGYYLYTCKITDENLYRSANSMYRAAECFLTAVIDPVDILKEMIFNT